MYSQAPKKKGGGAVCDVATLAIVTRGMLAKIWLPVRSERKVENFKNPAIFW